MKINKLMLALLAGAMFASCSDDRANEPVPPTGDVVGSTGYISVAIGMPAESASRGANDVFDDGTENEYTVKNAAIIFFEGNLPDPSFSRVYPINSAFENENPADNQITNSTAATFPVNFAKESNQPLYALAVLNYDKVFSITPTSDGKSHNLGVYEDGNTTATPFGKDKGFVDLLQMVSKAQLWNEDGTKDFFMTNIPYSRVPGGTTKPTFAENDNNFRVLADVLRQNIYETEAEAKAHPAAEIFVERAVAKVQVKLSEGKTLADLTPKLGVTVQEIKWVIDNTEPSTYIIRNLEPVSATGWPSGIPTWAQYINTGGSNYRFIGALPLKDLARYRTYFCANPADQGKGYDYLNYYDIDEDGNATLKATATLPLTRVSDSAVKGDITNASGVNPQYCNENTFDVEHMDYFNTTRATIKVKFASMGTATGTDADLPFYTVGLDQTTRYIFADAASILTRSVIENPQSRAIWTEYFNATYTTEAEQAAINKVPTTLDMTYSSNQRSEGSGKNIWMEVTMKNNGGRLKVTNIVYLDPNATEKTAIPVEKDDLDAIIAAVNAAHVIKAYLNSEGYFAVRIKHFGNEYTPWTAPTGTDNKPETALTTKAAYKWDKDATLAANNYLGRYGVVRNNWYVVEIDAINSFGEPTVADLPLDLTSDDKSKIEESIACRINILSWAKRTQNEEL